MTATPNPDPHPAAEGAVKTCDAGGMAMIHRYFRNGFREGPALVRGVTAGKLQHAEVVGSELATLSSSLHVHHEGEDARLWSTVEQRAPACALHVGRMRAQHAEMLVHLKELDAALPRWRATADPVDAEPVLAALAGINEALGVHLGDEETTIVPVMEHTLTQAEVEWFGEHGRAATPRGQTWNVLGAILAAQPDKGTAFLAELPPPVRWLWALIGRRRYQAHREALLGAG